MLTLDAHGCAGPQDEYSNEIAVMKELDHPNLVKLYEVIHDPSNNKLLMLMEYVEGGCVLAGSSPTQKVQQSPESVAVWLCGSVEWGWLNVRLWALVPRTLRRMRQTNSVGAGEHGMHVCTPLVRDTPDR